MATPKHDAICEAALELFAEQGVNATTTREIAERAGAAEGTLYRHFQGKDDLVRWLFESSAEQFQETLLASADGITAPRARLRALIRGVFAFADDHPAAFTYLLSVHHTGILQHNGNASPPPMRTFADTLTDGIEQGAFRDLPPVLATGWIVAMAQRAVVFLQSEVVEMAREDVIRQTVDAALRIVDAECTL
jgi:AcrR family transcriptional regulator